MADDRATTLLRVVSFNAAPKTGNASDPKQSMLDTPAELRAEGFRAKGFHEHVLGNKTFVLYGPGTDWESALQTRYSASIPAGHSVPLEWGDFGEDFSVLGDLGSVRVGDEWTVGDARIRITGLRSPVDLVPAVHAATGIDRVVLTEAAKKAAPAVLAEVVTAGTVTVEGDKLAGASYLRLAQPGMGATVAETYAQQVQAAPGRYVAAALPRPLAPLPQGRGLIAKQNSALLAQLTKEGNARRSA